MKKSILIIVIALVLLTSTVIPAVAAPSEGTGTSVTVPGGPNFWVDSVSEGKSVTLRLSSYPHEGKYNVDMTYLADSSLGWINAGTIKDEHGRQFSITFNIPKALQDKPNIAVRLVDSRTYANAYTIFTNNRSFTGLGTGSSSTVPGDLRVGSSQSINGVQFWIHAVEPKESVTIKVTNYESDVSLKVFIADLGAPTIYWKHVGTIDKGKSQGFLATYHIPSEYRMATKLAIKLAPNLSQDYAYTTFTNETNFSSNGGYSTTAYAGSTIYGNAYYGVPTIYIINVVEDSEVTIQTNNFPAGKTFNVLMNVMGTNGRGGVLVGTQDSGEGGSFVVTYPIPASLYDQGQIAIRLEDTESGYYAYNWFYNVDGDLPGN